jgi:hypothetical protein
MFTFYKNISRVLGLILLLGITLGIIIFTYPHNASAQVTCIISDIDITPISYTYASTNTTPVSVVLAMDNCKDLDDIQIALSNDLSGIQIQTASTSGQYQLTLPKILFDQTQLTINLTPSEQGCILGRFGANKDCSITAEYQIGANTTMQQLAHPPLTYACDGGECNNEEPWVLVPVGGYEQKNLEQTGQQGEPESIDDLIDQDCAVKSIQVFPKGDPSFGAGYQEGSGEPFFGIDYSENSTNPIFIEIVTEKCKDTSILLRLLIGGSSSGDLIPIANSSGEQSETTTRININHEESNIVLKLLPSEWGCGTGGFDCEINIHYQTPGMGTQNPTNFKKVLNTTIAYTCDNFLCNKEDYWRLLGRSETKEGSAGDCRVIDNQSYFDTTLQDPEGKFSDNARLFIATENCKDREIKIQLSENQPWGTDRAHTILFDGGAKFLSLKPTSNGIITALNLKPTEQHCSDLDHTLTDTLLNAAHNNPITNHVLNGGPVGLIAGYFTGVSITVPDDELKAINEPDCYIYVKYKTDVEAEFSDGQPFLGFECKTESCINQGNWNFTGTTEIPLNGLGSGPITFGASDPCFDAGLIDKDCYTALAPLPIRDTQIGAFSITNTVVDGVTRQVYRGPLSFSSYINLMIEIIIGFLGIISVVMIMVAGVQYMTTDAMGQKSQARDRILNAVIGLLIAIGSFIILNTINPNLLKLEPNIATVVIKETGDDGKPISIEYSTAQGAESACPGVPGKVTCVALDSSLRTSFSKPENKNLETTLHDKVLELESKLATTAVGRNWRITEAWMPTLKPPRFHEANCHKIGTCIDANFSGPAKPPTPALVRDFINTAISLDLCPVYEVKPSSDFTIIKAGVGTSLEKYLKDYGHLASVTGSHFSIYNGKCKF